MRWWARALVLLVALPMFGGTPAQAQAPVAQGWWYSLHRTGAPQPPPPPGVGENDLLLQGGDPNALLPHGTVDQSPAPTALAALRFTVAPGSHVGALVLAVADNPMASDVRAYPTNTAWVPAQRGAYEMAPVPDLTRSAAGVLQGNSLVFKDIGSLVGDNGSLSVVLVPGPLDRVVITAPTAAALTVTPPPVVPALDPGSPPSASVTDVAPPALTELPPVAVVAGSVAPAPMQPQLAAQPVVPPAALEAASALVPDDTRTRVIVLLEAVLVLATFGLLGYGPLSAIARLTGQPAAAIGASRGVGRFRSDRTGPAPRL